MPASQTCLVEKFCEGTPPGHNDVTANTQNFKPIILMFIVKKCSGDPHPRWGVRYEALVIR